jgi:hypothetical protein
MAGCALESRPDPRDHWGSKIAVTSAVCINRYPGVSGGSCQLYIYASWSLANGH